MGNLKQSLFYALLHVPQILGLGRALTQSTGLEKTSATLKAENCEKLAVPFQIYLGRNPIRVIEARQFNEKIGFSLLVFPFINFTELALTPLFLSLFFLFLF